MSSKKDTTQRVAAHAESPLATSAFVVAGCVALTTLGGILPSGVTRFDSVAILLAVAASVLAWKVLRRGSGESLDLWVLASAVGLAVWTLAAALVSGQPWISLTGPVSGVGALQLVLVVALVAFGASHGSTWWHVMRAVAPIVLGLQVVLVIAQVAAGERPTGSPNSAVLAGIIALSLPLTLAPAVVERTASWRWGLAAAGVLALAGTRSATGLAVGLLVFVVAAFLAARRKGSDGRSALLAALAGAALTAASIALIGQRLSRFFEAERALGSRPDLWEAALAVWGDSPLAGVGPEGFRVAVAASADAEFLREGASTFGFGSLPGDPHNVLLAILSALGAIGIALVAALGIAVVRRWLRTNAHRDERTRWILMALVAYGVTLLVQPATMQTLPLAGLMVGLSLYSARSDSREARDVPRVLALGFAVVVLAAAVLMVALSATRLVVGRIDQTSADAARRASAAADLWSVDPMLHYVASWRWYEAALTGATEGWALTRSHGNRAAELAPVEPVFVLNRAVSLAGSGAPRAETEAAFDEALAVFPLSVEANGAYAVFLLDQGDAAGAREPVETALSVTDDSIWIHGVAEQVYSLLGDVAKAAGHAARINDLGGQ